MSGLRLILPSRPVQVATSTGAGSSCLYYKPHTWLCTLHAAHSMWRWQYSQGMTSSTRGSACVVSAMSAWFHLVINACIQPGDVHDARPCVCPAASCQATPTGGFVGRCGVCYFLGCHAQQLWHAVLQFYIMFVAL